LLAELLPGKYINRGEKRDKVQAKKCVISPRCQNYGSWVSRLRRRAPGFDHACFRNCGQLEEGSKLFEGASDQSAPNL